MHTRTRKGSAGASLSKVQISSENISRIQCKGKGSAKKVPKYAFHHQEQPFMKLGSKRNRETKCILAKLNI